MSEIQTVITQYADKISSAQQRLDRIVSGNYNGDADLVPLDSLNSLDFKALIDYWLELESPHEPEFEILKHLANKSGTILDIGGNAGYSVTSIRCFQKQAKIISIEPLPFLEPAFAYLKEKFPEQCDYRIVGAGESRDALTIYLPVIDKDPVTPLARIKLELLRDEMCLAMAIMTKPDFEGEIKFAKVEIDIVPLDSLDAKPFFIKLDVEGFEFEVLKGLSNTLATSKPLVMLEGANRDEQLREFMQGLGYLYADFKDGTLKPNTDPSNEANGFFFHTANQGEYKSLGVFG